MIFSLIEPLALIEAHPNLFGLTNSKPIILHDFGLIWPLKLDLYFASFKSAFFIVLGASVRDNMVITNDSDKMA